jgi:hypothetical protein
MHLTGNLRPALAGSAALLLIALFGPEVSMAAPTSHEPVEIVVYSDYV